MIIIGYQGIGKSTLSNTNKKYIDLESSMWRIDGIRNENWYREYCNVAEGLSRQGYIVFTSSHTAVREQLKNSEEDVYVCFPALQLKDEWVHKLKDRYIKTQLDKDYRAWKNAEAVYTSNIWSLKLSGFPYIRIESMDYNLKDLIEKTTAS